MTWNYQIVERHDGSFGLYEVYIYKGKPRGKPVAWAMSEEPAGFVADADEGSGAVIDALRMALRDAESLPVLRDQQSGRRRSSRRGRSRRK